MISTVLKNAGGLVRDVSWRVRDWTRASGVIMAATLLAASSGQAATLTSLAFFGATPGRYPNGESPLGGLVFDAAGNLYGTTFTGGAGHGTVFELSKGGVVSALVNDNGPLIGAGSAASLIIDANGALYGVNTQGGRYFDGSQDTGAKGTLFEVSSGGVVSVLATFTGPNGAQPAASLLADSHGNLYGTTEFGGAAGDGTVFKLSTNGALTTLATFTGANGAEPIGKLTADAAGNLYGTTRTGGQFGVGTVFELSKTGVLTTLATFNFGNGAYPNAGLIIDAAGNLYGTARQGGAASDGVIFKIAKGGPLTTLATFTGPNGAYPQAALIEDAAGNLFGTAAQGGASPLGLVFELSTDGALHTLASFTGPNGSTPTSELIADAAGNLYGTTEFGGPDFNAGRPNDGGTVFEVSDTGFVTGGVSPAPEPGTWALMMIGFGLVGVAMRRRRAPKTIGTGARPDAAWL